MPKESTHLFLAGKIRKTISDRLDFQKISMMIEKAPHLFSMGSVAPDSIYNYVSGPAREYFRLNIENSHGGGKTGVFDYFTRFGKMNLPFVPALSFGLGILCHLTADMIFHPMVYYFCGQDVTGKVSDPTVNHFYFESALDRTLRWIHPELKKERLKNHFNNREMDDKKIALALEALHLSEEASGIVPMKEFISMYRQHTLFDGFYGSRFFKNLAVLINSLSRGGKPDLESLFYSDKSGRADGETADMILSNRFEFRNPVTGVEMKKSLTDLINDFVNLYFDFLRPLEELMPADTWEEILPVLKSWIPRSPKTGLPMIQDGPMRFHDIKSFNQVLGIEI